MRLIRLWTIFMCLLIGNSNIYAEICISPVLIPDDCCNQYNESGKRNGLWVHAEKYVIKLTYYKNGLRDGLSRIFLNSGSTWYCSSDVLYLNDNPVYLIGYYPNGNVEYVINDISLNTDFISSQEKYFNEYVQPLICYQAYQRVYRKNGDLKAEGWVISVDAEDYWRDAEIVGRWIIYTPSGEAIHKTGDELRYSEYHLYE